MPMKIHLIAIGGAVMHNLALALNANGHEVSGSDDEIYEPAKSRLQNAGLLPELVGWDENRISKDIDVVILGMHAREDNPELRKSQELGLNIQSFPEFFAAHSQQKRRVVIAGSHGKTTTTAMIMHVLKAQGVDFDYLVGAQLKGFDTMVRLSDAPIAIIEGDEYLSSPLDQRSKFHWYKPEVAVITGIAWDHINVFQTEESYLKTFTDFVAGLDDESVLFVYRGEPKLKELEKVSQCRLFTYDSMEHENSEGQLFVKSGKERYPLQVFGEHNLQNLQAAKLVCGALGIDDAGFAVAIASFEGAGKRLEKVYEDNQLVVYRDFAHAPSKVHATTKAVRDRYPDHHFIAAFELHTFSSLNEEFIAGYRHSLLPADLALVYCDPHVFQMKKMPELQPEQIARAFDDDTRVFQNVQELKQAIQQGINGPSVILLMSSGNFGGMELSFGAKQRSEP
jgi:UDP-N-acetylmuramate: L-alanyl-gamma-D-glutamyl-meso-diaminopimelate ligase